MLSITIDFLGDTCFFLYYLLMFMQVFKMVVQFCLKLDFREEKTNIKEQKSLINDFAYNVFVN